MAKSRAQQAAIAISMKKAGKKPKKMKSGGYPKSDKKDFMKRMGYYQAGGLATPPMYGANTIPGSPETAAITYQEADPAKLKQLEQELEEARKSTEYMDEAEANIAKQQAQIQAVEGAVGTTAEALDKSGLLKRLAERLGRSAAEKTAAEAGKVIGTTTTQAAIEQAAPGAFQKVAPKVVTGVQTAGMKAAQEGTVELAKATMPGAASPGMLGAPTLGTVAAIGGEVLKQVSSDDDATTMNVGETAGSVISGAGQGIGAALTAGALLGSSVGPLGTVAGAIGGAAYGLGKGLIQRGKARREEARAEQRKEQDISELASRQRLEALKSREYSGFDMGADIARYGGIRRYNDGGVGENLFQKGVQKTGELLLKKAPGIVGRLGKFGTAVSAPAMLYDFYNRGQEMSGGKVRPNITEEEMNRANPSMGGKSIAEVNAGIPKFKGFSFEMGGVKLPGGVAKPIPGSDAIEFKGKSHEQGGIMVDPNTEVEGNETMDKVTMKNGGKSDYFFSQHLKLGGKSFAQRHKDLLKNGGTQGEIDYLAKLQEEKAGRNPEDVKLGAGGYKMYQDGGSKNMMVYNPEGYYNDGTPIYNNAGLVQPPASLIQNFQNTMYPPVIQDSVVGDFDPITEQPSIPATNNTSGGSSPKKEERKNITPIQPKTITQIPVNNAPAPGTYVDLQGNTVTPQMGPEEFDYDSLSQEDKNVIDKANSDSPLTKLEERALRRLRRDVPGLAIAAGAAQLIAPAYAFFKKDRVAEQMGAPGRIKAPALDRVSYNAERASNAAQNRAISRSIDTSGAGPAGIMAKMATYRRKQEGDIKIAAAESRANIGIANQEAQMQMQTDAKNVSNAMQADQINTQLRERQLAANEDRRLGAIDSFTERTAGLAGDLMSYKANERLARATGDMGIYERERLRNFLSKEINPRTKKPYTNAEIAQLFNIRFGEAQATKETKEKDNE